MSEDLRDRLDAVPVPTLRVGDDLWRRGRRRRLRDRAAIGLLLLALIGGSAGLLAGWHRTPRAEVAGTGDVLGVPDHLHAVPERLTRRQGTDVAGWTGGERVESRLDVGTASAAWITSGGVPVVVGADDGAYHLLDLPDYQGNNRWADAGSLVTPTVTLSPSGRYLAYSWATFGPDAATKPIPSGIKVLDLIDGGVVGYPIAGAEGTAVEVITWSPDERWIGWAGARMRSWTLMSMSRSFSVGGRIRLASSASPKPVGLTGAEGSVAITDAGRLRVIGYDHVYDSLLYRGGTPTTDAYAVAQAIVDTTGRRLAAAALGRTPTVRLVPFDVGRVEDVTVAGATTVAPLAWVDERRLLVAASEEGAGRSRLVVIGPEDQVSDMGVIDGPVPRSLSVATDLVTPESIVVTRPAPDWPWSDERKAWTAVGGAVLVALMLLALSRLRDRRRRSNPLVADPR